MKAATIRCRAFMVGDWCCDKHGFPMQITNVGDDYAYATFEGNEGDPWEFDDKDDQPKPIPLTSEILEKNGWERDIDKEWEYNNSHILPHYYYQWEKRNVKIEMYAGLEGFTISLIIGRRFYAVHELQHVLRLYGLDELADNFKV